MTAYYNENDPFAAAWLRNLITLNLISQGEVDERSIVDVQPSDIKGFTQCHFFAGIGIWSYALRQAGWPDDKSVWTGSCPCQSFSSAGARKGFNDKRHLWPEFFRLISQCRPDTILGEQVASKDALAWLDLVSTDLEGENYAVGAVDTCAAGFGAPHIRQRLWWVANSGSQRRQQVGRSASGDEAAYGRARWNRGEPHGDYIVTGDGEAGGMADSTDSRRQEARQHGSRPSLLAARPAEHGGTSELADTESQWNRSGNARTRGWSESPNSGELGHSNPARSQRWQLGGNSTDELPVGTSGMDGALELSSRFGGEDGSSTREGLGRPASSSYWSDCDWLPCIDGKARPVEPGTFPLAHGVANRVGTLRGYGNALVAPQAQAFIEAYMECA